MGSNFLAVAVGAFSGAIYTSLYGRFADGGHPQMVWYVLAAHAIVSIAVLGLFQRIAGGFAQQEA